MRFLAHESCSFAPDGYYLESDGKYYKHYTEAKTFWEAQSICNLDGAHLTNIDGEETLKVLKAHTCKYENNQRYFYFSHFHF